MITKTAYIYLEKDAGFLTHKVAPMVLAATTALSPMMNTGMQLAKNVGTNVARHATTMINSTANYGKEAFRNIVSKAAANPRAYNAGMHEATQQMHGIPGPEDFITNNW